METFFQKDVETMSRRALNQLQLERLRHTVDYAIERVPLYRERFTALGIDGGKIKSLDDLRRLPFTTKEDVRKTYPYGMFAVPMKEIVRIHASSGTTGKPTVVGYTRRDLDTWSTLVARLASAVGVTDEDIAQISFGYGLFTGALGLHYALEKIGASVIPISAGNTRRQLMVMKDFGTTVLIATPSYALYISEIIEELGMSKEDLKLRVGLFGGEGCTAQMREIIEQKLGIIATDNYGMSELIGPGVAGECYERDGLHIAEDHFIAEIIDPESGEVLPEGSEGEIVFTSLTKEAFPIIRYRTGDISRLNYAPCRCGRTHARMDKVMGRSDDMIVLKGVNVFPSQIESVIVGMQGIGPNYMIYLKKKGHLDTMEIEVELADGTLLNKYEQLEAATNFVKERLHSVLGLSAKVTLVEPKSLQRFEGKAKRIIDLRNEK